MKRLIFLLAWLAFASVSVGAVVVDGVLTDVETGEPLVGAYVFVTELSSGTVTDADGYYRIELPKPGTYTIQLDYVGYEHQQFSEQIRADKKLNLSMRESQEMLGEIVLEGESGRRSLSQPNVGTEKFTVAQVRKLPAFMGEVDVIKAIQLLPGVQASSEGSSAYNVRGGSSDQNLVLLDQAPVYNPSHLLGFFSVFNNDVVDNAVLYKGDIPAMFGGRLSSMMEVTTKEDTKDRFSGRGGIGLISSRLQLEGPLVKDHLSLWAAGRVFYSGLLLPMMKNPGLKQARLTFYDVNAKLSARIDDHHRLSLSGYTGQDYFKYQALGRFDYSNKSATLRWSANWDSSFVSNTYLIGSWYDFQVAGQLAGLEGSWVGTIADYGARQEFAWMPDSHNKLKIGLSSSYKIIHTGSAEMYMDEDSEPLGVEIPPTSSVESALSVANEQHYGQWTFKYGLRASLFNNLDSAQNHSYYWQLEPRAAFAWQFRHDMSLKASFARTSQYLHQVKTTTAGTPMDLWRSSNQVLKPGICDQVSAGYVWNFYKDQFQVSGELFYKWLQNQTDFRDYASVFLNSNIDEEFLQGRGRAFGAELMLRRDVGKLTGWVSYTFVRSFLTIDGINDGREYSSSADRPHNITLVLNYDLLGWIDLGLTWVYSTGQPLTAPESRLVISDYGKETVYPVYGGRNQYRMPDYHRLDLAMTFHLNKGKKKRYDHDLNISFYNVYCRHNAWKIDFETDEESGSQRATLTYLFSIIPSVTYNFYF